MKSFSQLLKDMNIKESLEKSVNMSQYGTWSQYHTGNAKMGIGPTTHDMHNHVKDTLKKYPNHKSLHATAKKHSDHITELHQAHMALKAAEKKVMNSKREFDKHHKNAIQSK